MIRHPLHAGFSLVETLVAITILLVVIIGPMTISISTAKSTSFASEQVVAFFLAQEGAEIAQKARDENWLDYFDTQTGTPWADFIDPNGAFDYCFTTAGCGLELRNNYSASILVRPCQDIENCRLKFLDGNQRTRYTHTNGVTTPYTRVIRFVENNNREVEVISTVTWRTGSLKDEQRVVVKTYLFNVYGY